MGAVVRTFCNGLSVTEYCEVCFDSLNSASKTISLTCFIRNDIAHFINMICRWKCFQAKGKRLLKEFFVRCARLLLQARSLAEFTEILRHVLTIAYSQTECTTQYSLHFIFQLLEESNNEESPDTNNTIFNIDNTSYEELEVEELDEASATSSNFQSLLDSINQFIIIIYCYIFINIKIIFIIN